MYIISIRLIKIHIRNYTDTGIAIHQLGKLVMKWKVNRSVLEVR